MPDRRQQVALVDRLRQVIGDADIAALGCLAMLPRGAQHHDRRAGKRRRVADAARDLEPVHFRHVCVEQDERKGTTLCAGVEQGMQRGRAAVGGRRPHLPANQQVVHDAPVYGVVVDDQHAKVGQVEWRQFRARVADAQAGREMERAAFERCALEPDAPVHQLDQRRRNRQTETSASELARRRSVCLLERLEHRSLFFARDADAAVAHEIVQHGRIASR